MAKTVYFLIPRRDSNDFEWEECQSQVHLNIRMRQEAEDTKKPRSKIGISVTFEELGNPPYQFPIFVPWLRPHQAILDPHPEPGDSLIVLLELKKPADFTLLQSCTLEEALALCETFDGAG